jgi:hypothetical protein
MGACIAAVFLSLPAMAAEKADLYAANTCPVSGKELGAEAVTKEYEGRQVRFCCAGCPAGFEKDTAASLAKLDEAIIEAQEADYPLTTCINSGAELGEKPVSFVIGNRLVKTCCSNCKSKVEADEAAFLEKHAKAVTEKLGGEDYPSKVCAVSGEELGSMGEPVNVIVGNKLVKLCCAGCEKAVVKDPAKHVAKVYGGGEAEDGKKAN